MISLHNPEARSRWEGRNDFSNFQVLQQVRATAAVRAAADAFRSHHELTGLFTPYRAYHLPRRQMPVALDSEDGSKLLQLCRIQETQHDMTGIRHKHPVTVQYTQSLSLIHI